MKSLLLVLCLGITLLLPAAKLPPQDAKKKSPTPSKTAPQKPAPKKPAPKKPAPKKPAPKKPAPKKPAPPALGAPDRDKFMRVISMGTNKEGKGIYFPQRIVLLTGEYIYLQFRCNIPQNKIAKIQILSSTGNYNLVASDAGEGNCLLTVGISSRTPQRCRSLHMRMLPIDSNKWISLRRVPVDIEWVRPRTR